MKRFWMTYLCGAILVIGSGLSLDATAASEATINVVVSLEVEDTELDSDGDGLSDLDEVNVHGTDPLLVDSDGDGIPDGTEVDGGTDPLDDLSFNSGTYVDGAGGSDETGFGTQGNPWATITHAVSLVAGNVGNTIQIHVAEGTYDASSEADGTLRLDSYESLLGGYEAGGWTRDIAQHETIIDGAASQGGLPTGNVVVMDSIVSALLEGFTITGGDTAYGPNTMGGGVLARSLDVTSSIAQCVVRGNFADRGGALALDASSATVLACRIIGNSATDGGGGLYITGAGAPVVSQCVVAANTVGGTGGGGLMADLGASPVVKNTVLSGNDALLGSGGAIFLLDTVVPVIVNNTISDNAASPSGGGAIALAGTGGTLTNNIFSGNIGVAIVELDVSSDPILSFNLFDVNPYGDYFDFDTSTIYSGAVGVDLNVSESQNSVGGDPSYLHNPVGTWSEDPAYDGVSDLTTFVDVTAPFGSANFIGALLNPSADGTLQAPVIDHTESSIQLRGDYTGIVIDGDPYRILNYHIAAGSPAVDAGENTSPVSLGSVVVDLDGETRGLDGDGLGAGATGDGSEYDIGADEVTPPTLTITHPNGGETFVKGTVETISWTSTGDVGDNVRIDIRRGGNGKAIVVSTPNDGSYDWTLPAWLAVNTNYFVEITSVENPGISDVSDGLFAITDTPPPADSVTVLSPNGGESWARGQTVTILWSSSGVTDVDIDLERASGPPLSIATGTPSDGSFAFNVPVGQDIGTDYTVRVTDTTDASVTDVSDAFFEIVGAAPASISVVAPNGGEIWVRGQLVTVQWSSSSVANVDIDLARAGSPVLNIATGTPSDGTHDFTVPVGQDLGSDYTIRVTDSTDPGVTDDSDAFFGVIDSGVGSITVTRPNGGETFVRGTVETITWSSTGDIDGPDVSISIARGSRSREISASTPNDGSFDWSIPANYSTSSSYSIEVTSVGDPGITDGSDATFTITDTPPSNSVTVVAPNGGETWVRGDTVTILWNSTGVTDVDIDLLRSGSPVLNIVAATPSDGAFDFLVPVLQDLGSDYTVRVADASDPGIADDSNNFFDVVDTLPASVTVTAPNGGENWVRGTTTTITWSSSGVASVDIALLRSGIPVLTIATATPSDGAHDFAVPVGQDLGSDYAVRVTDSADPGVADDSDASFSVVDAVAGTITVTQPNGGEVFVRGAAESITWTSTGNIGGPDVRILIRRGSNSRVIVASTPNDGSFSWTIPSNYGASSNYFIEVSSVATPGILDVGDGTFTIQ